jgi:hypothetical protein
MVPTTDALVPLVNHQLADARAMAARAALAVCASADALAHEASAVVGTDDDRLFALIDQRELLLQDLAVHLAQVTPVRSAAAGAPLVATGAADAAPADDPDALLVSLREAITLSEQVTSALASRVAQRLDEIRVELEVVQRAMAASQRYGTSPAFNAVDRMR